MPAKKLPPPSYLSAKERWIASRVMQVRRGPPEQESQRQFSGEETDDSTNVDDATIIDVEEYEEAEEAENAAESRDDKTIDLNEAEGEGGEEEEEEEDDEPDPPEDFQCGRVLWGVKSPERDPESTGVREQASVAPQRVARDAPRRTREAADAVELDIGDAVLQRAPSPIARMLIRRVVGNAKLLFEPWEDEKQAENKGEKPK